jgi:hypothetical protein
MHLKPGKARVTGEHYTHRSLWSAAEILRQRGRPDQDAFGIFVMASMLFVYLSFEAYLNDLGIRVSPKMWKDEKAAFGRGQYRGTLGKAEYLAGELRLPLSRGSRPFQTVVELDHRRDMVVHGHTEILDREVQYLDPRQLSAILPEIRALSDIDFLDRAFEDTESVCDKMQARAQARLGSHVVLSPRAFRGMLMHQGGAIIEPPG